MFTRVLEKKSEIESVSGIGIANGSENESGIEIEKRTVGWV